MKVLQLTLGYPPSDQAGGAATVAHGISNALSDLGHAVVVAAPKLRGTSYRTAAWRTESDQSGNTTVYHCGTWLQRRLQTVNPAAFLLVPMLVQQSDCVIIHGVRIFVGTIGAVCCWLFRKPYIVYPHGMVMPRWRSLYLKRVYDALIGDRILSGARIVACLSRQERDEVRLSRCCESSKVRVASNRWTRDGDGARAGPVDWQRARVLFLGRVVPEKGIDLLVEALAEPSLSADYEVVVAGPLQDESYAATLRREAEVRGVSLRFVGLVRGKQKAACLAESHLLALVSEWESWGCVVAEALEMGTPVLVCDTCGIARDLDEAHGLVVARTATAIRAALDSLREGQFAKLKQMRRTCQESPWEAPGASISELLEELVYSGDCKGQGAGE